jgi:transcriptional regulator with XRE-family HTH domain
VSGRVLLRSARWRCGLSQRELALRAGDHQPTIAAIEAGRRDVRVGHLERLVARAGCRLSLIPTTAPPVAEAAAGIAEFLAGGDVDSAWRAFIQANDDLTAAPADVRVALCVCEPTPTGDPRFDASLAALVSHQLGSAGLPVPAWVDDSSRFLAEPWYPDVLGPRGAHLDVPAAFARHGVLIAASELESA